MPEASDEMIVDQAEILLNYNVCSVIYVVSVADAFWFFDMHFNLTW